MKKPILVIAAIVLAGLAGLGMVRAQQRDEEPLGQVEQSGQDQLDTQNGAARVSFIRGDVSVQHADAEDISDVTLNTPIVAGDRIVTGDDSRAELELDYANVLRLDANADAHLVALNRTDMHVQIGEGVATYSVMNGAESNVEIEAPNVSVHPLREGDYRVQVIGDTDAEITIRNGEADVSTDEGNTRVHTGQVIAVHGTGQDAEYQIADAPALDEWDQWNRDRNNVILNARSYDRTNRYYTGAHDLDANGVWTEVPDYGNVWVPRVAADWAPYRAGRWAYEPYYGWTWVSAEPWGWAPYHYGRWFVYNNAWVWWPGPVTRAYRPVWAPAYVSFFGFGGGGGVSVGVGFGGGFGSIGWLPIGPGDYFHPWWGGYRQRYSVVDIHNVYNIHDGVGPLYRSDRFSNIRNVMTNERLRSGVSGVPAGSFGRGFVHATPINASELREGHMFAGNLPVNPTRDSRRFSDRPVNAGMIARVNSQQRFFSSARRAPGFGATAGAAAGRGRVGSGDTRTFQGQNGQYAQNGNRPGQYSNQAQGTRPGWQRFSQSGSAYDRGGRSVNGNVDRSGDRGVDRGRDRGGDRYAGRGENGSAGFSRSQPSGRPPLDMSKPIVSDRYAGAASRGQSQPNAQSSQASPGYRGGEREERSVPNDRQPPIYRSGPAYESGAGVPTYSRPSQAAPPYRSSGGDPAEPAYRGRGGAPTYQGSPAYRQGPSYQGTPQSAPVYRNPAPQAPAYRSSGGDQPRASRSEGRPEGRVSASNRGDHGGDHGGHR